MSDEDKRTQLKRRDTFVNKQLYEYDNMIKRCESRKHVT